MRGRYPDQKPQSNVAVLPGTKPTDAPLSESRAKEKAKSLMPRGLRKEVKAVWNRIAPELAMAGRLKRLYLDAVLEYCEVKARMDAARSELDKEGWTYETEGRYGVQIKSPPAVAQLNDDWRKWNSLVAQLGLSPATELRFNDAQGDLFNDADPFRANDSMAG